MLSRIGTFSSCMMKTVIILKFANIDYIARWSMSQLFRWHSTSLQKFGIYFRRSII